MDGSLVHDTAAQAAKKVVAGYVRIHSASVCRVQECTEQSGCPLTSVQQRVRGVDLLLTSCSQIQQHRESMAGCNRSTSTMLGSSNVMAHQCMEEIALTSLC